MHKPALHTELVFSFHRTLAVTFKHFQKNITLIYFVPLTLRHTGVKNNPIFYSNISDKLRNIYTVHSPTNALFIKLGKV
jgi:hypothetical protein